MPTRIRKFDFDFDFDFAAPLIKESFNQQLRGRSDYVQWPDSRDFPYPKGLYK